MYDCVLGTAGEHGGRPAGGGAGEGGQGKVGECIIAVGEARTPYGGKMCWC